MHAVWFKAKEFGWGWSPASWEGWTVTVLFVVGTVLWALFWIGGGPRRALSVGGFWPVVALVAAFIAICWMTSESPR